MMLFWIEIDTCMHTSLHVRYSPFQMKTLNFDSVWISYPRRLATGSCTKLCVFPLSIKTDSSRFRTHPVSRIIRGLNVLENAYRFISVADDEPSSSSSSLPLCSNNNTKQLLSTSIRNNQPLHLWPGTYDLSQLKHRPLAVRSFLSSTVSIILTIGNAFVPDDGILIIGSMWTDDVPFPLEFFFVSYTLASENAYFEVVGFVTISSSAISFLRPLMKKLINDPSVCPLTSFRRVSNCSK